MQKNRKTETIAASKICKSTILPSRSHDSKIAESVRTVGLQQPLIVRPIPDSDKYELIDGNGRLDAFKGEDLVDVQIRTDAENATAVFSISDATFQRRDRSVFERAQFYAKWSDAIASENHMPPRVIFVQDTLAKKSGLSDSAICQYMAIYDLFEALAAQSPSEQFGALKNWSFDKLYRLSHLRKSSRLLEVARQFEKETKVGMERVAEVVRNTLWLEKDSETPEEGSGQNEKAQAEWRKRRVEESRDSAEKIMALIAETHETLDTTAKEVVTDSAKFSSIAVLKILTIVLQTLMRLKKYSDVLRNRVRQDADASITSTAN